jgi:hypothetical protein
MKYSKKTIFGRAYALPNIVFFEILRPRLKAWGEDVDTSQYHILNIGRV